MLFAVDAIDGAGKSTLVSELIRRNPSWIPIRFPGSTREGAVLRDLILNPNFGLYPIPTFFAFMTDFCQTYSCLEYDEIYIMDRSIYSVLVHQVWGNKQLSQSKKKLMERIALEFVAPPLHTFVLHLPWSEAKRRANQSEFGKADNIEGADDETWVNRSELYFHLPEALPLREFTVYDVMDYPLERLATSVENEIKEIIKVGE